MTFSTADEFFYSWWHFLHMPANMALNGTLSPFILPVVTTKICSLKCLDLAGKDVWRWSGPSPAQSRGTSEGLLGCRGSYLVQFLISAGMKIPSPLQASSQCATTYRVKNISLTCDHNFLCCYLCPSSSKLNILADVINSVMYPCLFMHISQWILTFLIAKEEDRTLMTAIWPAFCVSPECSEWHLC